MKRIVTFTPNARNVVYTRLFQRRRTIVLPEYRESERERESCDSAGARANRERLKFNDNRDGLGTRHRDRILSLR